MRTRYFLIVCLSVCLSAGCHGPKPAVGPPTMAVVGIPKPTLLPPPDLSPYAGEFYFGDGLGVNCSLKLTKEGNASFQWHGCEGLYDKNQGTYTYENDQIVLHLTAPNTRDGFQGTPTRFYPVQWGPRLYLIADEQMLGFCSRVAMGWIPDEDRHGFYYLRGKDNENPVRGEPSVPALFQPVLKQPFTATITSMKKGGPILIDRGRRQGIFPAQWDPKLGIHVT